MVFYLPETESYHYKKTKYKKNHSSKTYFSITLKNYSLLTEEHFMKEWQTVFRIPENIYQEWESIAQKTPITYWVLQNQKIEPNKYFEWASIRYNIPVLKSSFVKSFNLDQNLWKQIV